MFLLSEQFRLEIHWDDVLYEQEGVCRFLGAYFSGPALKIAQKINDNDSMMLDLYSQYVTLTKGAYVLRFAWDEVIYADDGSKVYLKGARVEHDADLNRVPNLRSTDYFVIDTSDHKSDIHQYALVYKTLLIREDHERYRFEK